MEENLQTRKHFVRYWVPDHRRKYIDEIFGAYEASEIERGEVVELAVGNAGALTRANST